MKEVQLVLFKATERSYLCSPKQHESSAISDLPSNECCGSGPTFNVRSGSGSGFGMRIRIQLFVKIPYTGILLVAVKPSSWIRIRKKKNADPPHCKQHEIRATGTDSDPKMQIILDQSRSGPGSTTMSYFPACVLDRYCTSN